MSALLKSITLPAHQPTNQTKPFCVSFDRSIDVNPLILDRQRKIFNSLIGGSISSHN
jgi:hypothetical protein